MSERSVLAECENVVFVHLRGITSSNVLWFVSHLQIVHVKRHKGTNELLESIEFFLYSDSLVHHIGQSWD